MRVDNEDFELKGQSAQDCGRYDFIKDTRRLEHIVDEQQSTIGYAVLLTNDSSYWTKPIGSDTVDANFRLHDGRALESSLRWGDRASDGTKKNRANALGLRGKYLLKWETYSHPGRGRCGEFRSLTVKVMKMAE